MTRVHVHLMTGEIVKVRADDPTEAMLVAHNMTDNYDPAGAFRIETHVFPWASINWIEVEDYQ